MKSQGFTLLELLVVMAISGIVLTVLFDVFTSSNRSVADGTHYAQELRELQISGAIVADDVRKAQYIYPAAETLTLESVYPATVSNPETNTNTWETKPNGSFFAQILPVDKNDPDQPCGTDQRSPALATNYEFIAYYLVRRAKLTSLPLTDWRNPGPDPTNDDKAFVLMRYNTCIDSISPAPTALSGGEGRFVADYIDSAGMSVTANRVTLSLVSARLVMGRTIRIPAADASPNMVYVTAAARNSR